MKTPLNPSLSKSFLQTAQYDAVVVGAGPYGLATAAHLRAAGLNVAVFGIPLQLWREHMPEGMLLRSFWWASNISDPEKRSGLQQYFSDTGQESSDPLPARTFIDYGLWFQQRMVPDVDTTYVETIEQAPGQPGKDAEVRYVVTLTDGRVVYTPNIILAPGLRYYIYRPEFYNHLSAEVVSHTADSSDLGRFAGKRLVIIGGGQSALENAALASECGAEVHLVTRRTITWIKDGAAFPEKRSLLERIRHPKAGISPDWFSWSLEHFPYQFQRLPLSARTRLLRGRGSYGPMGSAWLKPRISGKVTLYEPDQVERVDENDAGVVVRLSSGKILAADHLMLGTGYRANVSRLPMLHSSLLSALPTFQGTPVLNNRFESGLPGLYFVGFTSVMSCGPLYRFVVGTDAAASRVAGAVARDIALARK